MNIIMAILLSAFGGRVFWVSKRKDKVGRHMGLLSIYMGVVSALSHFDFGYTVTAAAAIIMVACQVSFILLTVYYLGRRAKAKTKIGKKGQNPGILSVA